jgi:hypothetical protein
MNSTASFVAALLELIGDFFSEFRSRMIAMHLIRSVAIMAAKYRATQHTRRRVRRTSKMCLVLEQAGQSNAWLEQMERKRLSRRLEPVRQAIVVADEIIEKTFPQRRTDRTLSRYVILPRAPEKHRDPEERE